MSIDNPKLSTEWKDSELSEQQQQWQSIISCSADISRAAADADWVRVLPLAEHRQALIDNFFESSICLPLFHQIVTDLASIQEEHKQVLIQVQRGIDRNDARYESLLETKEHISENF